MTKDKDTSEQTPFERMVDQILHGKGKRTVDDISPEDFLIVLDAIANLFFNQKSGAGDTAGIEGFAEDNGLQIEFSRDLKYPATRKAPKGFSKIIVLPDNGDSEETKELRARQALKEFDCLGAIRKYELCVRIFHTFAEAELIELARKYDPLHRDTTQLAQRLTERAERRSLIEKAMASQKESK